MLSPILIGAIVSGIITAAIVLFFVLRRLKNIKRQEEKIAQFGSEEEKSLAKEVGLEPAEDAELKFAGIEQHEEEREGELKESQASIKKELKIGRASCRERV